MIFIIGSASVMILTNTYIGIKQTEASLMEKDRRNLEAIKGELINNIIDINGNKLVPFGENDALAHYLPSWLNIDKVNPFGNKYIYCPYSSTLNSSNTNIVRTSQSSTYSVETINNMNTKNRDYVLGSISAPHSNVIALVISRHNKSEEVNCNNITMTNGMFTAPKAFVIGIYEDSIIYNDILKSTVTKIDGLDELVTLQSELTSWSAKSPYKHSIEISLTGNHTLLNNSVFENNDIVNKNTLVLNQINNSSIINGSASNSIVEFINVNVILNNIVMNNNITFKFTDSNVTVRNSVINGIVLENSDLDLKNSNIKSIDTVNSKINIRDVTFNPLTTANKPVINSFNSEINLLNNVSFLNLRDVVNINLLNSNLNVIGNGKTFSYLGNVEIINAFSSKVNIINSTISVNRVSGNLTSFLTTDISTDLTLNNVVLTTPQVVAGMYLSGRNNINNLNLNVGNATQYALVLNEGAYTQMSNTIIGNGVNNINVGIHDQGSLFLKGSNNIIRATTCRSGNIFSNNITTTIDDKTVNVSGGGLFGTVTVQRITQPTTFNINLTDKFNKFTSTCN